MVPDVHRSVNIVQLLWLFVSLVVVVFLIVVFAAHRRNIYGIFPHGSTHVIDTAAQGLISSSAVVQEGGQKV